MNTAAKRKLRPFDFASCNVDMSMYDRIKYVRDIELCPASTITLWNGNFIRFFNLNTEEPYVLKDMDALVQIKIEKHLNEEKQRNNSPVKPVSILEKEPGLDEAAMEEKLDKLMIDSSLNNDDEMDFSAFDDSEEDFF